MHFFFTLLKHVTIIGERSFTVKGKEKTAWKAAGEITQNDNLLRAGCVF